MIKKLFRGFQTFDSERFLKDRSSRCIWRRVLPNVQCVERSFGRHDSFGASEMYNECVRSVIDHRFYLLKMYDANFYQDVDQYEV